MLAYIFWHRPARGADAASYERALELFHRSLAHRPPSGFRGSVAFRVPAPAWLQGPAPAAGGGEDARPSAPASASGEAWYEDWYLLENWSAVGVLEEAAVARGHVSRHDAVATMAGTAAGAIYRLSEGQAALAQASIGVWVERASGHPLVRIGDLLADGIDPRAAGLWRRCLVLGPAPEYCLMASEVPAGIGGERLPAGWRALVRPQELLWGE